MAELLLELLSEEIPARMQGRAAVDLERLVTKGLEEVHKKLELKGYFKTDSPATEPRVPNCFFFPRPNGAFFVVRFETTEEDESWGRTANGKACCYFNRLMDLKTACEAVGGAWMGKDGCTCQRKWDR